MAAVTQQGNDTRKLRCNVYVASLPLDFDDDQLFDLFSPYGRISSARIMRSKGARQSRGYGFVLFRHASSAEKAIDSLVGYVIGGSRIQVRLAHPEASVAYSGQRGSRSGNSTPGALPEKTLPAASGVITPPPPSSAIISHPNDSGMMVQTYPITTMYPTMYPSVVPQIIAQPQAPVPAAMQQVVFLPQYAQQSNQSTPPTFYMMVPDAMQAAPPTLS
ncbi:RNA-binding protein [Trypanosoma brucei equiperdum]|uniref:RNA-binding protein n=1 Tax=Trypanosoma brucei equiperdum TaxID=630700 RepID=A0A3L6KVY5_9TRYP|nr:RNA-binding protein [Trypanosoma brucei equiperdum]